MDFKLNLHLEWKSGLSTEIQTLTVPNSITHSYHEDAVKKVKNIKKLFSFLHACQNFIFIKNFGENANFDKWYPLK